MRALSWEEVKTIIRRIGGWGILIYCCLGQKINPWFILHKWHSSHEGHQQSSKKGTNIVKGFQLRLAVGEAITQ